MRDFRFHEKIESEVVAWAGRLTVAARSDVMHLQVREREPKTNYTKVDI